MAWGGHENWAADRGCHAATCSWKEIPRKHGFIHGRSSPNPPPAQVTKPAPRRIGGTQAHKLLIMGFNSNDRNPCHLHQRLISTRHYVIIAGHVMSSPETHQSRTAPTHYRYAIALPFPTNVKAHPRAHRSRKSKKELIARWVTRHVRCLPSTVQGNRPSTAFHRVGSKCSASIPRQDSSGGVTSESSSSPMT